MEISVELDRNFALRLVRSFESDLAKKTEDALNYAAIKAEEIILNRTEKGIGYKGKFAPYTKAYERKKGSSKVNLMVTGKMLSSISHKVRKEQARISFTRAAEARKAAFNNARRPFFGLNGAEMDQVRRLFIGRFKK